MKGPFWKVETGRRDGNVSILNEALQNLLSPFANITTLKQGFLSRGLSVKDLVVLSGILNHMISQYLLYSFASSFLYFQKP